MLKAVKTCMQADTILRQEKRLRKIFKVPKGLEPGELYGKLAKLEKSAEGIALRLCNGPEFEGGYEEVDRLCERILNAVDKLLGFRARSIEVFLNRDPRGHSLKVGCEHVRALRLDIPTDWGGYGILVPELPG